MLNELMTQDSWGLSWIELSKSRALAMRCVPQGSPAFLYAALYANRGADV
jgi:hypothetical protein